VVEAEFLTVVVATTAAQERPCSRVVELRVVEHTSPGNRTSRATCSRGTGIAHLVDDDLVRMAEVAPQKVVGGPDHAAVHRAALASSTNTSMSNVAARSGSTSTL